MVRVHHALLTVLVMLSQSSDGSSYPAVTGGRVFRDSKSLARTPQLARSGSTPILPGRPVTVTYDRQCFMIGGHDFIVYSGAFHYFRCPRPLWEDRLRKMREAHLNTVETYIPWNWHERKPGSADLRDFEDFLRLCERLGLFVIARPGPYICAEWDAGGFPRWLPGRVGSLRDNSRDSVGWSRHWYDLVLPVIRRHQATAGGAVIMVQLENEYDYFTGVSDSDKKEYMRSLLREVKSNGIHIPIISCWTKQVRDRLDPDMRQIIDSDNFYPKLDVKSILQPLRTLAAEQPDAPLMVTELQGGWFSGFGTPASVDQPGIGPEQENALIKTAWSAGAAATNYYMFFGGTNFGYWGGKGMTTSYDYAAPIREPGGLWDKYFVTRSAGKFVELFGSLLARSVPMGSGPTTDMRDVSVIERTNGTAGFLFVRNDADQRRDGLVTGIDTSTHQPFDIGVHLEPHGAKILPVNVPVGGATIRRSNAEIAGVYKVGARSMVVLAGDAGESLQATLSDGSLSNRLGPGIGANLPSDPVLDPDQMLEAPGGPLLFFTTTSRAARMSEIPSDRGSTWAVSGGFYRIGASGATDDRMTFDANVTEGNHFVTVPLPRRATRINVDGVPAKTNMGTDGLARLDLNAGTIDIPAATFGPVRVAKEMWGGGVGWKAASLRPLDEIGITENGYTRYRCLFSWKGEQELVLNQFASDPVLVAVNGRAVAAGGADGEPIRVDLARAARSGINRLEVLYENAGRPNFGGPSIWERKGLRSAMLVQRRERGVSLEKWRFRKSAKPGDAPREAQPSFDDSNWESAGIGELPALNGYRGWAWYRTTLNVSPSDLSQGRTILNFEGVDDNAIVYVNGQRAAENRGWNHPFSIDVNRMVQAGPNTVAVAVENTDGPGGIVKAVTLTSPEAGEPLTGWEVTDRLQGETRRWMRGGIPGPVWPTVRLPDRRLDRSNTVRWYRTSFRLPVMSASKFHAPWKLQVEAGGEAIIFVNGYPIGRYSDRGPQSEFYLPEPWIHTGQIPNIVCIAIRDGVQPAALKSIHAAPYKEFATRRFSVSVDF